MKHLLERWETVKDQVDSRLSVLEKASDKLQTLQSGIYSEQAWLDETERKVASEEWETEDDSAEAKMEELTVSTMSRDW